MELREVESHPRGREVGESGRMWRERWDPTTRWALEGVVMMVEEMREGWEEEKREAMLSIGWKWPEVMKGKKKMRSFFSTGAMASVPIGLENFVCEVRLMDGEEEGNDEDEEEREDEEFVTEFCVGSGHEKCMHELVRDFGGGLLGPSKDLG